MVLYRVYSEAHLRKYYSTVISRATLFQIIVYAMMVVFPALIAYETREFWAYSRMYRERPEVVSLNQSIVLVGGDGVRSVWSSYPELTDILQPEELDTPNETIYMEDEDGNGGTDVLYFTVEFYNLNHSVQYVQFLLPLQVELDRFSTATIQSLVQSSQLWTSPASKLWVGAELTINQRVLLPASGRVNNYSSLPDNITGSTVEEFVTELFQEYNQRDISGVMTNPYQVWTGGHTGNFTLELELRLPSQTILYEPGFWQLFKFAWIQYLALLVVFWYVLKHVQSFVFQNQVILTVQRRTDKPHKQY